MIVTMHQPNFLPWMGFLYKMLNADIFVHCDTLAFSKGSYTQRVKIKTQSCARWLTVPLIHTGKVGQIIKDVRCGGWANWRERLVDGLRGNYLHCSHYQPYADGINQILMSGEEHLARLNIQLIAFLADQLKIKTRTVCTSDMQIGQCRTPTDWIIAVCKEVGGDTFLSGAGGAKYQDEKAYGRAGIKLVYSDFKHPTYPQQFGEFVEGLSIVDLLFNCGPDSADILRKAGGGQG